ncbi:hypothetical protein ABID08_005696 [Rhizobium binae]|uniref:Uncharacterized protein n=1 Tax=Rhizobium binae TaxID=1138190 RepID=A0ABV2MQ86_9HYPH
METTSERIQRHAKELWARSAGAGRRPPIYVSQTSRSTTKGEANPNPESGANDPRTQRICSMLYEPAKLLKGNGVAIVRTVGHALPVHRSDRDGCRIHSKTDHEHTGMPALLTYR